MHVLHWFDPWKGGLCTCGRKYSLDPYTGCAHGCLYCYASSYIPNFFSPRPKKDFIARLERDLNKAEKLPISISNSSDPYQPLEKKRMLTRKTLELLNEFSFPAMIVTKSDLVLRDIPIIEKGKNAVAFTITSMDDSLSLKLEPNAPPSSRRILALKRMHEIGVKTIARIDPLIPEVNEHPRGLIEEISDFTDHFVFSTYKAKPDNLERMVAAFPSIRKYYCKDKTERMGNYLYLERNLREKILFSSSKFIKGRNFGFCREGFIFQGKSCDGTHLLLKHH